MTDGPSDKELVSLAQSGDRSALGRLLERHQGRLFNVVLRMVGGRDDAADVTQEVMVKIIQGINRYHGRSALTTWMIRIAMNTAISHLRKRRVRRAASLEATTESDDGSGGTSMRTRLADTREPAPDEGVQDREMIERLKNAIDGLELDFRSVLILRDIDQMPYEQIAEVLQVPTGTVKSRLFRARLSLRQHLVDGAAGERDSQAPRGEMAE